eukprot:605383-Hanusia_phi.AAC.1
MIITLSLLHAYERLVHLDAPEAGAQVEGRAIGDGPPRRLHLHRPEVFQGVGCLLPVGEGLAGQGHERLALPGCGGLRRVADHLQAAAVVVVQGDDAALGPHIALEEAVDHGLVAGADEAAILPQRLAVAAILEEELRVVGPVHGEEHGAVLAPRLQAVPLLHLAAVGVAAEHRLVQVARLAQQLQQHVGAVAHVGPEQLDDAARLPHVIQLLRLVHHVGELLLAQACLGQRGAQALRQLVDQGLGLVLEQPPGQRLGHGARLVLVEGAELLCEQRVPCDHRVEALHRELAPRLRLVAARLPRGPLPDLVRHLGEVLLPAPLVRPAQQAVRRHGGLDLPDLGGGCRGGQGRLGVRWHLHAGIVQPPQDGPVEGHAPGHALVKAYGGLEPGVVPGEARPQHLQQAVHPDELGLLLVPAPRRRRRLPVRVAALPQRLHHALQALLQRLDPLLPRGAALVDLRHVVEHLARDQGDLADAAQRLLRVQHRLEVRGADVLRPRPRPGVPHRLHQVLHGPVVRGDAQPAVALGLLRVVRLGPLLDVRHGAGEGQLHVMEHAPQALDGPVEPLAVDARPHGLCQLRVRGGLPRGLGALDADGGRAAGALHLPAADQPLHRRRLLVRLPHRRVEELVALLPPRRPDHA